MRELTTVIMPVYNGEKYIEDAISSVLSQTYKEIELVIVNDGSTDATSTILENYACFERIRVISYSNNLGKVHAINVGYSFSNGNYIVLLAADDVLTKNSIEERVASIQGHDFAFCKIYKCDENLNVLKTLNNFPKDTILKWSDYCMKIAWSNIIGGGSLIISKRIAENIFPIPEELKFEDWWITFTGLYFSKSVYFLDKPLLFYRIHDSNDNGSLMNKSISYCIKRDYQRHLIYYKAFERFVSKNIVDEQDNLLNALKMNYKIKEKVINSKFIPFDADFIKLYGFKRYLLNNLISKNLLDSVLRFLVK